MTYFIAGFVIGAIPMALAGAVFWITSYEPETPADDDPMKAAVDDGKWGLL